MVTFFFVAGTSIYDFTVNATGQVQTRGSFFGENTFGASALFAFGNKLVAALNVGGIASFNIPATGSNYTLDGRVGELAEELQAADTYAYGAIYACRWAAGTQGNFAYYLNTVPTVDLGDVAQGEVRTALLDNTIVAPTTTAATTATTTSATTATTTGAATSPATTATTATTTSTTATTATTGAPPTTSTSVTTGEPVVTTTSTSPVFQVIILKFPAATALTDEQLTELITRAGGNPDDFVITSVPDANQIIVLLTTSVIDDDAARDIEEQISRDAEFVAAGGKSSVKTNQSASTSSTATLVRASAALLMLLALYVL